MTESFAQHRRLFVRAAFFVVIASIGCIHVKQAPAEEQATTFRIVVDRGTDRGQPFGSLFETKSEDGSIVVGAGFPNLYNTRLRADRHAIQFYVRPTDGQRSIDAELLPRPNDLCGTYLYGRDEAVYSTYGGLKRWDQTTRQWAESAAPGGTQETMRVGRGILAFGDSAVTFDGRTILARPQRGSYQLFFYADGYLCFYHIDRGEGGYRPFVNEADGFSKLYACPWTPDEPEVDLTKSVVMTLPVVGETTFAWGRIGRQIVTGSNVGGFYVFENGQWRSLLAPNIKVSYQLYSTMAFYDRLLMGQYPTGRLFEFDGMSIADRPGWPPVLEGVSPSAREAQTTVIYGGELFVGVWPWGELWRYQPDMKRWFFVRRMFDHPQISDAVIHPYDAENRGDRVPNQWGQRVTSLVTSGSGLFVSSSAKDPCMRDPERAPFLEPEKWKEYGSVHRLTMPGHLSAATAWTDRPTTFELTIDASQMTITQDGRLLARTPIEGPLGDKLRQRPKFDSVRWGEGIYGEFTGPAIQGEIKP